MGGHDGLDPIDRLILKILSDYDSLGLLQLWYELGESDESVKHMTREEVLSSLESLRSQGFVESVKRGEGDVRWALTIKREATG
ncbi:MAG: hypothetical protein ACE5NJ_04205 [Thermodesulfobacteriota bacterium]